MGGLEELVHPTGCYPIDRAVVDPNGNSTRLSAFAIAMSGTATSRAAVRRTCARTTALRQAWLAAELASAAVRAGRGQPHASRTGNYCNIVPVQIGFRWYEVDSALLATFAAASTVRVIRHGRSIGCGDEPLLRTSTPRIRWIAGVEAGGVRRGGAPGCCRCC